MNREMTCIICPVGCTLTAELEDGKFISVSGNCCSRGSEYAKTECTCPTRSVTTTVLCDNGTMLPVKTNRPIPKNKIFECMEIINSYTVHLPISSGDVIIENVFGSDIIATKSVGETI